MTLSMSIYQTPSCEQAVGECQLPTSIFDVPFNEPLVHQVITAYQAGMRAGTKAQKTRAEVTGGAKKPWRQKGTGRARAGCSKSPIWVGGGRAFAAQPRDYSQKLPRKMYRGAIRSMISAFVRSGAWVVVESLEPASHKTKDFLKLFAGAVEGRVLLLTHELTEKLYFSCRNIPEVFLTDVVGLDPLTLASAQKVVITAEALKEVEAWLA